MIKKDPNETTLERNNLVIPKINLNDIEKGIKRCFEEINSELKIRILIVGGWTRNKLLGLPSDDIDIVFEILSIQDDIDINIQKDEIQTKIGLLLSQKLKKKKFDVKERKEYDIQEEVVVILNMQSSICYLNIYIFLINIICSKKMIFESST